MLVSVFSDASCCGQTGAAGWAGWVKSQRGTSRSSGRIKQAIDFWSDIAEAMAAVNAVRAAILHGVIKDGDELLIQTDNRDVPTILGGGWPDRKNEQTRHKREINLAFAALLGNHELKWRWRWVQGHVDDADREARHSVNMICDREAGKHMRAQRSKMLGMAR